MARFIDYSKKTFTGAFHWTELVDDKFTTVGNARVSSLFNIPFENLQELGISRIETEDYIEVFCQRQEWTEWRGKQTKTNYDNYQIVRLDYEYLLEWQARLFNCLNWNQDKVEKFLQKDTLEYISNRMIYLRRKEIERNAEKLAEQLGIPKEKVLAQLLPPEEQPKKEEPIKIEHAIGNTFEGALIKLSNEWFVSVGEDKDLYKVPNKRMLIDWFVNNAYETTDVFNLENYLNTSIKFQKKQGVAPPRSRQAKGWVDVILGVIKP